MGADKNTEKGSIKTILSKIGNYNFVLIILYILLLIFYLFYYSYNYVLP